VPFSLYTAKTYAVDKKDIERDWCLSFFESGHVGDYLLLYADDQYQGIISYKSISHNMVLEDSIISEKLFIGDRLWEDVQRLFDEDMAREIVPVFNNKMDILYIAKYDERLESAWAKLSEMQNFVDKELWKSFHHYVSQIHIKGINDVLFELRNWLISLGVEVSVEGEIWRCFGIEEKVSDKIEIIDKECEWLESLYKEYYDWLKKYSAGLKKILCKAYIPNRNKKDKVMFYLTRFPYFTDSIKPLIFRYIQSDKECILVFPELKIIMSRGADNVDKLMQLIKIFEGAGAKCYFENEKTLYDYKYFICFSCSEYSGSLPLKLRNISKYVVAVQVTALYTHMYQAKGRFEQVFSEQSRKEIDYLVTSKYIADWICAQNHEWSKKILRFGYPKLDTLYYSLKNKSDIPHDWREKIGDKKVVLFTTYIMERSWLDYFAEKEDSMIAIWRPHPHTIATTEKDRQIKEISERYNIIIDNLPSYELSFQVSDALVAALHSSIMVNYLCTGKPIFLYGKSETYQTAVIDYREELWYKCINGATADKQSVLVFLDHIEHGDNIIGEEQDLYRKYMMNDFDGGVCNRIYNFFEKKVNTP